MFLFDETLEDYLLAHTSEDSRLLAELRKETQATMQYPQMLCGPIEGKFLQFIVQMSGAKYIVEVGTFTGYSALSMAQGLSDEGKIITCETRPDAQVVAERYFKESPHGHKIDLKMGPALSTLESLASGIDLAFVDADKVNYPSYYNALIEKVRPGGLLLFDNALWSGKVINPEDEDTQAIADLNSLVTNDRRVENVLLSIRDGIQMVRKIEDSNNLH